MTRKSQSTRVRRHLPLAVGLACASAWLAAPAVGGELVRLEGFDDRSLEVRAFRVERPVSLQLECVGATDGEDQPFYAQGWILKAATREVVWALAYDNSKGGRGHNRVFEGALELEAGDYLAHYSVFWSGRMKEIRVFGQPIIRYLPKSADRLPRESRDWRLLLATRRDGDIASVRPLGHLPPVGGERVFVNITSVGDDAFETRGFTLPERQRVEIYCQGEFVDANDGVVDTGWILDARTRERVWELSPDNFEHGGGSFKNRVARRSLTLPAGDYIVSYATDGSHSAEGWNAPPPYDPQGWGILLWAADAASARRIRPYEDVAQPHTTLVSLLRQGNGAYAAQGFALPEPLRVHVYAVGEYDDRTHQFVDRGWIERLEDAATVWEMTHDNTRHAGGAKINRVAEENIQLDKGSYVAYYTADGGHAYRDWLMAPPYDPTHWGIEITAAEGVRFESFDPEKRLLESTNYLVRLVRVRDDEHVHQTFHLDRPARLRVVSVGEGSHDEMYDYGWIEDRRGRTVWEMRLRDTRHAGGARKNRIYDGILTLQAGEYEAHFVTDDSHAWGSFNQPPPHDPQQWGICVIALDGKD